MTTTLAHPQSIQDLDLSQIEMRMQKKFEWSAQRTQQAVVGYRDFLSEIHSHPDDCHSPSNQDVDEIWHQHILHTKQYGEDCQLIFGRFVHHAPKGHAACCNCCEG